MTSIDNYTQCPVSGICGGCTFQDIAYEQELCIKEKQVLELLSNSSIGSYSYTGITASPNVEEYRNKMELAFGDESKGGALALGMRKRNSFYEVVTASHCNIMSGDFRKILICALDFFAASEDIFYHKRRRTGSLRHLVLRRGEFTGEILVNIVTTSGVTSDLSELADRLTKLKLSGMISGILHTVNNSVSDAVKCDELKVLYGVSHIHEKICGLNFKITPFSFFQTNSSVAELLYQRVKNLAGDLKGKVVYDLYCGTGTITQIISDGANEAVGVELVPEAVEAAVENAHNNGIKNCRFIAGDVLEVIKNAESKPDLIVLDPPRAGIHPKAIQRIIALGCERIIYVSCNPTSLVRDLEVFNENGYSIGAVSTHDLFPRTTHVETVVLMSYVGNKG